MINKLLLREIKIKSELIKVLNDLIMEQSEQLHYYQNMMNDINDIMNNNAYIDI